MNLPPNQSDVRIGMEVIGADGIRIGQVSDLRQADFLVDRAPAPDLFIPYQAVQTANADQLRLRVMSDQVDLQDWETPYLRP
jgi:hypothetical protein